jgi:CheY-specific phosphatase CheX
VTTSQSIVIPEGAVINGVLAEILTVLVGAPVQPTPRRKSALPPTRDVWTGWAVIGGRWNGAIALTCRPKFVRQTVSRILEMASAEVTDDLAIDVLAEFTNVVGGNVKSLITADQDGVCSLSLPTVVAHMAEPQTAALVLESCFQCGDDEVFVELFEAHVDGPRPMRFCHGHLP